MHMKERRVRSSESQKVLKRRLYLFQVYKKKKRLLTNTLTCINIAYIYLHIYSIYPINKKKHKKGYT